MQLIVWEEKMGQTQNIKILGVPVFDELFD
jgi:hypothetical protein